MAHVHTINEALLSAFGTVPRPLPPKGLGAIVLVIHLIIYSHLHKRITPSGEMNQSIIYSDRLNTTGMKTPLMKHFCSKPQTLAETLQLKLIFSNTFNINMFWYKAAVVKKNEKTKKQNLCPGMYLYNSISVIATHSSWSHKSAFQILLCYYL